MGRGTLAGVLLCAVVANAALHAANDGTLVPMRMGGPSGRDQPAHTSTTVAEATSSAAPNAPSEREQQWLNSFSTEDPNSKFNGNVKVNRVLQAREVLTATLLVVNMTARGNMDVAGSLTGNNIKASTVASELLETGALRSPSGVVVVNGDLTITSRPYIPKPATSRAGALNVGEGTHNYPAITAPSFLAENIVLGGVPQWKLVRHDDFETGPSGWSLLQVSSCSRVEQKDGHRSVDHFLGGHCNMATGQVTKSFAHLPPHSQVRVTGRYHMIDHWRGETAFLRLQDHVAWSHRSHQDAGLHGIEMCGNIDHPEAHMSLPVDVTIPHTGSFLEVAFGSTGAADQDPCQRSFGVDDVMLYVK